MILEVKKNYLVIVFHPLMFQLLSVVNDLCKVTKIIIITNKLSHKHTHTGIHKHMHTHTHTPVLLVVSSVGIVAIKANKVKNATN